MLLSAYCVWWYKAGMMIIIKQIFTAHKRRLVRPLFWLIAIGMCVGAYHFYPDQITRFLKSFYKDNTIRVWAIDVDKNTLAWLNEVKTGFEAINTDIKIKINTSDKNDNSDIIITNSNSSGMLVKNEMISKLFDGVINTQDYELNALKTVSYKDQIYGVPFACESELILYYNKDYVKSSPKTMNDIQNICQNVMNTAALGANSILKSCIEFSDTFNKSLAASYKDKQEESASAYIDELKSKKYSSTGCNYACAQDAFISGGTAMAVLSASLHSIISPDLKAKTGMALLPINSYSGEYLKPKINCDAAYIMNNTKPQKHNAIKQFLNLFSDKTLAKKVIKNLEKLSPLKSVYVTEELVTTPDLALKYRQFQLGRTE